MGQVKNQPCSICSGAASKYKCPTCLAPYCSVACCRVHKQNPCSASSSDHVTSTQATSAHVVSAQVTSAIASNFTAAASHPQERHQPSDLQHSLSQPPELSDQQQSQHRPMRPFEDETNEDEAQWRLKKDHFLGIAEDSTLRTQLRNHELQRMLLVVDSSANPAKMLEEARKVPLFAKFMSHLEKHLPASAEIREEQSRMEL